MNTQIIQKGIDLVASWGPKLVSAIIILFVGLWVIKKILGLMKKIGKRNHMDQSLQKFLANLVGWGLKVFLIVTVMGQIGIATTSFVAILGAAGLAVGLALQGSLGNFAGGVLILIFKPFQVGDLIEAHGNTGVVKEIEIFVTKIVTPHNRTVIIPNGALSNDNIVNYSTLGQLRVDLVIGISYDSSIKDARDVLLKLMTEHSRVLKTPAPSVNVLELADSSVNLAVRPWCKGADYWTVYFEVLEQSKEALEKAGIEIPYPHQVVHIYDKNKNA